MTVTDYIKKATKTLFSFELLPPLKGENIQSIYDTIDPLMEFNPSYINITYHREEILYKKREAGLLEKKVVRKRPGTVGIAAAIKYKYKIDVVPHIICGGFSSEETENALIDLHFLGIYNLLVVRGDNLKSEKYFIPEKDGHAHAADLVRQIMDMNRGIYIDQELENKMPTCFSLGVAGYPEKHVESPNMQTDLRHLKDKVDAGAEYIVTQLFFDNKKYFRFVELCREIGITVPIIPGLKPISNKNQIFSLPQSFNIDIPSEFVNEIEKCKTNADAYQVGIEWAIQQSRELMKNGAPSLHFYTMGKSANIRKIAEAIF